MDINFIFELLNYAKALILALDAIYPFDGLQVSVWDMALIGMVVDFVFDLLLFTAEEAYEERG